MGMASNIDVYGKRRGTDAVEDALPQQTAWALMMGVAPVNHNFLLTSTFAV